MILRTARAACCLPLVFSVAALPSEKPWIEVRSPHFRVITDVDAQSALDTAREFEQMRAVFAVGASNMRLDSGAPLLVFAVRDAYTLARLLSAPNVSKVNYIGGLYSEGWERQFAVVRLDIRLPGISQPAYHEYVHSLLHMNFRWLPAWLDEGLAEFYGTADFKQNSAIVGEPSRRKDFLAREFPIPLKDVLEITQRSPKYHDPVFYAEAWALTHYLMFGDGMESGKKLWQFYTLLQSGMDQRKAFEHLFGPIPGVQEALEKYAHKGKMHAWEFNNPPQILEQNFAARKMTVAETEAELGEYSLWAHNLETARRLIRDALRDDSKLALAHENMGFLNFAEGKDSDAAQEFKQALQIDPMRHLSQFYSTMLSHEATKDPSERANFEAALFKTLQLNPQFAPAYIQLGRLYLQEGDIKKAIAAVSKAGQLEPSRAGYELMLSSLLLKAHRGSDAALIAKYVADRWQGPDHDEAVELWNHIPEDERSTDRLVAEKFADGQQEVEGTIKSTTCGGEGKDRKLTLTITKDGKELSFQPSKGYMTGFSDTLWYGRDHFSVCYHLEGLRAIVRYKLGSGNQPNDLQELEVRVDLPPDPKATASETKVETEK